MNGKVKWFDPKKGYGFIISDNGSQYFAFYNDIVNMSGYKKLKRNQEVEFLVDQNVKGQVPKAINIKVLSS